MKRSVKWTVVAAATVSVLGAGFVGGRAWAGGIPTAGALTYSGVLQKVDGSPLTSTGHNLEIKLWSTGPTGGTALCDTTVAAPTFTLDNSGRFSVQLDNSCTGAIGANADAWVEILLDGNTLNRTKLGAVPYSIEANHAVSADIATSAANVQSSAPSGYVKLGDTQIAWGNAQIAVTQGDANTEYANVTLPVSFVGTYSISATAGDPGVIGGAIPTARQTKANQFLLQYQGASASSTATRNVNWLVVGRGQ